MAAVDSTPQPNAALTVLQSDAERNEGKSFGVLPVATEKQEYRTMIVDVTAYTSRKQETDSTPFITANGTHVHDGILASNILPFGTKVRIPSLTGDKVYTVEDRMNVRYQNNVDIWVSNVDTALQIGRRRLTIVVF